MTRSSADRLRRLRLVLTLVFTTANTAALVVFAWLSLAADQREGEQRLDAELDRTTGIVSRLVKDDGGVLVTAAVNDDEVDQSCPQFAVVAQGGTRSSGRQCVPVDPSVVTALAQQATTSGRRLSGYQNATDGGLVRIAVEPFRMKTGQYAGAVVAIADAEPEQDRHDRMVLLVVIGCALAVGVLGLGGHVLSGRAIRPAAAALEQQEVLLAETAHDLRTPVAALRALAETALRNPGERAELLPRTVRLAARMGGIIDGLLVRARLAAGVDRLALQPVWLDQLVAGVVEETPSEGASVTLTAAPSKVVIDPMLVQRAIGNLLDNALRYGRQPNQLAIVHITVANGRVTVADHGPGVDAALAEEVFDRFRTTSSSGSGASGLGLSIVRWVAQSHGGSLAVHNAEEGGAIFELILPPAP
ncbi:sensor histidine kinase [Actinokineospora bangkokensis]|uniref:histidine kinase n=1 Tax=Actinokineospora bangkokensis TaxID=1193682 RepID=A0A1Q9LTC7_9PSEU|nr:HAMP domain-containing sensor histidine kinase [Actinokineospora bangkokensis]OLR95285.1 two-component sensor histidine kinase [Actinokineospora bangkokensis]